MRRKALLLLHLEVSLPDGATVGDVEGLRGHRSIIYLELARRARILIQLELVCGSRTIIDLELA